MSLEDPIYTPSYCEENVYHLARISPDAFVVFISNDSKSVPFWLNKSRICHENPEGLVVWDYHVVLIRSGYVLDLDAHVPYPCPWDDYLYRVLRGQNRLNERFSRLFRVITATAYVAGFASDRSHMLDVMTGQYFAPVPSYPPIVSTDGKKMTFLPLMHIEGKDVCKNKTILRHDLHQAGFHGIIMDEETFVSWAFMHRPETRTDKRNKKV